MLRNKAIARDESAGSLDIRNDGLFGAVGKYVSEMNLETGYLTQPSRRQSSLADLKMSSGAMVTSKGSEDDMVAKAALVSCSGLESICELLLTDLEGCDRYELSFYGICFDCFRIDEVGWGRSGCAFCVLEGERDTSNRVELQACDEKSWNVVCWSPSRRQML
jgi:hypothetical protein